jgi:hypothetical protein
MSEMRGLGIVFEEVGEKKMSPRSKPFKMYALLAQPEPPEPKQENEHEPWCALVISLNHGGPLSNRCDCKPKEPRSGRVNRGQSRRII